MHPADAADIIEHLSQNDRENLIKLNELIEKGVKKRVVDGVAYGIEIFSKSAISFDSTNGVSSCTIGSCPSSNSCSICSKKSSCPFDGGILNPVKGRKAGPGGAIGGYCDIVLQNPLIVVKCIVDCIMNASKYGLLDLVGITGIGASGHTPGFVTVFEITDKFNIVPGAGIAGGIFPNSAPVQYVIAPLPNNAID